MKKFEIYHNPRCSKSRQTLALLRSHDVEPEQILYMQDPPTEKVLRTLVQKLKITVHDLLRKEEGLCRQLGLQRPGVSEQEIIAAMSREPCLMQRPIVVCGGRAVLGRPPENVLALF